MTLIATHTEPKLYVYECDVCSAVFEVVRILPPGDGFPVFCNGYAHDRRRMGLVAIRGYEYNEHRLDGK